MNSKHSEPVYNQSTKILCVMDGFGLTDERNANAEYGAKLPVIRSLFRDYSWATLDADGEAVGQEQGLVGNSEVGHMNIGGLKIVPQLSYQITHSADGAYDMRDNFPSQNCDPKKALTQCFSQGQNHTVHLVTLFSSGSIHSDLRHLVGAILAAGKSGAQKIVLHLLSDGRDSDPKSLVKTWNRFARSNESKFGELTSIIELGSVGGRFYAMDRDNNLNRTFSGLRSMVRFDDKSWNMILSQYDLSVDDLKGQVTDQSISWAEISSALEKHSQSAYAQGLTDETAEPESFQRIGAQDVVWLLNFRTDRFRRLTQEISAMNSDIGLSLVVLGMNDYGVAENKSKKWTGGKLETAGYYSIFEHKPVENTLSEYIERGGYTQLHIAETEKYNHVTYFMNGGQNKLSKGEDWVVVPSNKVHSHAEKPEMKAKEVTDILVESLESRVSIRVAAREDLPEIQSKIIEYWALVDGADSPYLHTTIDKVYSQTLPKNIDQGNVMFITYDGQVCGFFQVGEDQEAQELFIFDLYVYPEFQNKGIGSTIIQYVTYLAGHKKIPHVGLWVNTSNTGALRLYERAGFKKIADMTMEKYDAEGNIMDTSPAIYMQYTIDDVSKPIAPGIHYDYVIMNYANPDMVAHTGDLQATEVSLEAMDKGLGRLIDLVKQGKCEMIVIADHGNAERVGKISDDSDFIDTQHNADHVPFIYVSDTKKPFPVDRMIEIAKNSEIHVDSVIDGLRESYPNIDLGNQDDWFEKKDLDRYVLPLWYCGLVLIAL